MNWHHKKHHNEVNLGNFWEMKALRQTLTNPLVVRTGKI